MVLTPSMFLLLFQPLCFMFPSLLHMLFFQNRKCSFKQYAPLSSYWNKDGRYFSFPFLWFQLNKKKAGLLSGFALLAESGAASAIYKWTIHKSLGHTTREVSTVPLHSGIFCARCGLLFPPLHHSSKLGSGLTEDERILLFISSHGLERWEERAVLLLNNFVSKEDDVVLVIYSSHQL